MRKRLPNIYILPKNDSEEQITYFNKHICSIITEKLKDGSSLSHIHLTNGQVIDNTIEHHKLIGSIEYYNQLD